MSKRKSTRTCDKPSKKTGAVQATLFNYYEAGQEGPSSSKDKVKEKPKIARDPSSYGIHVYTQSEIDKSQGNNKEFRKFWNDKAFELCSHRVVTSTLQDNRAAIEGAIYTSWTLHKTSLLELRMEEIENKCLKVYADEVTREHVLTVAKRNLERMRQAHASTDSLYSVISMSPESSSDISELQSQLSTAVSELKKSQEALQKSMERRQVDIDLAGCEEVITAASPEPLAQSDIEVMVKMIKYEDFQDEKDI